LDGYDEMKKVAVEFNGLFWHSEKCGKTKWYHYNKWKECAEQGIKLYTIFEDEWNFARDKVIRFIFNNHFPDSCEIYRASKTQFTEVDKNVARDFINAHHIQGGINLNIKKAYGLYKDNELLSVMSFAPHHRRHNVVTMNRFCTKDKVRIHGGASKLIKNASQLIGQDIVTWSDNRWSTGNAYLNSGWEKDGIVPVDYYWVDDRCSRRYSKQSRKKSATGQPVEMTEKQYNESLGWTRIWDCGKIRWIYKKES